MKRFGAYSQALFIVPIVCCGYFTCFKYVHGKSCEGEHDGCCDGYMFNVTLGKCTECRTGYFGENCSMSCPPKLYGRECQLVCNCSEDDCDAKQGCRKKEYDIVSVDGTTEQTTKEMEMQMSTLSPMQQALIALVSLLGFISIAHVALYFIKKHSKSDID